MAEVKVFQINEYDAVAAKTEEQAKEHYLQVTGLDEDEAFLDEITVVSLDKRVWADESMESKVAIKNIVEDRWMGEPFIATTADW